MNLLPLSFVDSGQEVVVRNLTGGSGMCQRLTELGLNRGTKIGVVKNDIGGPLILSVGSGRLALGRGMAMKIMVELK